MASLREKLALQKSVDTGLGQLAAGISSLREKLAVQKDVDNALAKLNGDNGTAKSLLDRFLAFEFTKALPEEMLKILRKVYAEAKGQIEPLKEPVLRFCQYHLGAGQVFESSSSADLQRLASLLASGAKGTFTFNPE